MVELGRDEPKVDGAGGAQKPCRSEGPHPHVERGENEEAAAHVAVDIEERSIDLGEVPLTHEGVLVEQQSGDERGPREVGEPLSSALPEKTSASAVTTCSADEMSTAPQVPNRAGIELRPWARSKSSSCKL